MDKKDVIYEIIQKVCKQNRLLEYQQIEDFLKLLNDDVLKQLYIYFCLDF
jgi:hypothetical protein